LTWTVVSSGATFDVVVTYDGTDYSSYGETGSGSITFSKNSITETTANVSIIAYDGDIVVSVSMGCPVPQILTVIEVVVTSDQDSTETIHTQYRYIDGAYVGPLQTNAVIFQAGTNPVVSRYNAVTGAAGSGDIPTEGSTLIIGTNKIIPDTYDFNPLENSFKYLRSNTFYDNVPMDINALLSASSLATPITGGPTLYQTSFVVPPNSAGDYLYLIWDLRNSAISNLCFSENAEEFQSICCDCEPCTDECITYEFTNLSATETADIYLPSGLCADKRETTITLEPEEVVIICITNAQFYITAGDVDVFFDSCGCSGCGEPCQQYTAWTTKGGSATINYIDCNTGLPTTDTLVGNDITNVCVPIGETVYVPIGDANVDLSDDCGCCRGDGCYTWQVTNPTASAINFGHKNCSCLTPVITVPANTTITYCAEALTNPNDPNINLEFTVISSCGCTL